MLEVFMRRLVLVLSTFLLSGYGDNSALELFTIILVASLWVVFMAFCFRPIVRKDDDDDDPPMTGAAMSVT